MGLLQKLRCKGGGVFRIALVAPTNCRNAAWRRVDGEGDALPARRMCHSHTGSGTASCCARRGLFSYKGFYASISTARAMPQPRWYLVELTRTTCLGIQPSTFPFHCSPGGFLFTHPRSWWGFHPCLSKKTLQLQRQL